MAWPVPRTGTASHLDRFMARLVTIKRPAEIERAGRLGQATGSRIMLVVVSRSSGPVSRVAIKAPRKVGCAVVRNRFRRRVKEILRSLFPTLESSWECVVIARPPVARLSFSDLRDEMFKLLGRAGVIAAPLSSKKDSSPCS